jgi:hypothetical protein
MIPEWKFMNKRKKKGGKSEDIHHRLHGGPDEREESSSHRGVLSFQGHTLCNLDKH